MPSSSFQFRVCQNPRCGLRYPLIDRSRFGERCPNCLGATRIVAEVSLEREAKRENPGAANAHGPQALLDNIRSAWNVGSIFRSAEGFGFRHLYLGGITPTPDNDQVQKTALGAQDIVPWSAHNNAVTVISSLKARGDIVWALEQADGSQTIESAVREGRLQGQLILVVGNEQAGIDPGILEFADRVVHISMEGYKRSFNVSTAFAVAAYAMEHWKV